MNGKDQSSPLVLIGKDASLNPGTALWPVGSVEFSEVSSPNALNQFRGHSMVTRHADVRR